MGITNDERRRIAANLRESWKPRWHGEKMMHRLREALEIDRSASEYGKFRYYRTVADRLADLIEPSCDHDTPQKVTEEMFGKMRHPTKEEADAYDAMLKSKSVEIHPVDRDALLALADEIKNDTSRVDELQLGIYGSCYLSGIARRIRKALGVSNDE